MIYVEYTFGLANGKSKVVAVKDLKENVTNIELKELADLFVQKNLQYQGSSFTLLKKCLKYTIETEEIS